MRASGGTCDALAVCRELLGRRATPAAGGGCAVVAMAAITDARPTASAAGRRSGARRRLRWRLVVVTAALLTLVAVPPVHAEEVFTSQAAAANATDSTWIPAPPQRAALCIVDTGNDPNPDTSNVIARLSVDGADGADRSPDHHGTLMSMIAAAPYNGFGMVGAAPSINIVSVRASRDGVSFGGTDLASAMQLCLSYRNTYNIKVISLSLGGGAVSGLDAGSMATIEDIVDSVRFVGLDVVAAVGNHVGSVDWPAGYGPVMAVGAADADGARCRFAASGPEVDLWTPGCPTDAALPDGGAVWASGSSESTAFTAGILTQLRQLRPDLTVDQAERDLTHNARLTAAGPYLDVGAAFIAGGLNERLVGGRGVSPKLTPSSDAMVAMLPAPVSVGSAGESRVEPGGPLATVLPGIVAVRRVAQLPRPSVRSAHVRHHQLSLSLKNRPIGIEARVQIYVRGRRRAFPALARTVRLTNDRLRTPVSGTVSQLSITYSDPAQVRGSSVMLSLRPG